MKVCSTSTELDPFRQPPARRNRIPLWIVVFIIDREAPIDELDEEADPQGDPDRRPGPNANPRHFIAMIGERIARHQRARARNAAAEPNPFPEDLIMAPEEEQRDVHLAAEVMPPGEQKILDDRYFELNMGFRFKRGRTEEENDEIFENLRFGPRDRINIVDEGNLDEILDMDLEHDETPE
uniref:Uncharacterized protein n=1 Tax=Ditylenchus dipsaci TaxID=166011 RepID=A0A915DXX6_9BILA